MYQIGAVNNEDAFRHQTEVASHVEKPLGFSKWLEADYMVRGKACLWVGDMVCLRHLI